MFEEADRPPPFRDLVKEILHDPQAGLAQPLGPVAWLAIMGGPEAMGRQIDALRATATNSTYDADFPLRATDLSKAIAALEGHLEIGASAVEHLGEHEYEHFIWRDERLWSRTPRRGQNPSLLTVLVWVWCAKQDVPAHLIGNTESARQACAEEIRPWASDDELNTSIDGSIWDAIESFRKFALSISGGN